MQNLPVSVQIAASLGATLLLLALTLIAVRNAAGKPTRLIATVIGLPLSLAAFCTTLYIQVDNHPHIRGWIAAPWTGEWPTGWPGGGLFWINFLAIFISAGCLRGILKSMGIKLD